MFLIYHIVSRLVCELLPEELESLNIEDVLKNFSENNKMKREASKFYLYRKVTCVRVNP